MECHKHLQSPSPTAASMFWSYSVPHWPPCIYNNGLWLKSAWSFDENLLVRVFSLRLKLITYFGHSLFQFTNTGWRPMIQSVAVFGLGSSLIDIRSRNVLPKPTICDLIGSPNSFQFDISLRTGCLMREYLQRMIFSFSC